IPVLCMPRRAQRWAGRLVVVGAGVVASLVLASIGAPAAFAAPAPDAITIIGPGLEAPIQVQAATQRPLFDALLRQVNWMTGRSGDFFRPDKTTFGPAYSVTVFAKGVAVSACELYPLAEGGPRAHMPAKQPRGTTLDAWFYAPVSLPSTLRAVGVPLPLPEVSGRAGALVYEDPNDLQPQDTPEAFSWPKEFEQMRLIMAATGATGLAVLVLVFAAARVSRRLTRRYR
ncbi:MAG: hypothetical protein J2P15_01470, partial [Micromonosporaceae bacterium]|nr:hypothetical protein [Micromonosporaceae bacterium]